MKNLRAEVRLIMEIYNECRSKNWGFLPIGEGMKTRIPRIRLMFFGVRPAFRNLGIDAVLFNSVKSYAKKKGYQSSEASLLLEDNHLILSPSEFMGAKRYKTWRIYDLPLSGC